MKLEVIIQVWRSPDQMNRKSSMERSTIKQEPQHSVQDYQATHATGLFQYALQFRKGRQAFVFYGRGP